MLVLNNKGFAVSVILYSISAIIIVVMFLILSVVASNVHNTNNMADEIKKEISGLEIRD